jgi:hypothetical protein
VPIRGVGWVANINQMGDDMMACGRMVRRTAKASNFISIGQAQSHITKLGQQEPKQVQSDSDRSIT